MRGIQFEFNAEDIEKAGRGALFLSTLHLNTEDCKELTKGYIKYIRLGEELRAYQPGGAKYTLADTSWISYRNQLLLKRSTIKDNIVLFMVKKYFDDYLYVSVLDFLFGKGNWQSPDRDVL
ncbi:MAG: hypothetical protein MJZ75_03530 [Paludibacteraceae bacterium]|nr:hypothetical protein [Paludibacteraceae bacterium]